MNSQDKPLEPSNNSDREFDLFEETNETDLQNNSQPKKNLDDLQSSKETKIQYSLTQTQDSDNSSDLLAEDAESVASNSSLDEFDLDLENLDLRNPPTIEKPIKAVSKNKLDNKSLDNEIETSNTEINESDNSFYLDEAELEELDDNLELEELIELENFSEETEIDDLPGTAFQFASPIELASSDEELVSDNIDRELSELDSLELEAETSSLDSLDLDLEAESAKELNELEKELESSSDLSDLNSLLGEESESSIPDPSPIIKSPEPVAISPSARREAIASSVKSGEGFSANKANVFDQTMRVSVKKLDDLNNLIGELVVKRNRLEEDQERLRKFIDNLFLHVQSLGDAGARMHDMYERSLLEGALMASRQSRASINGSKTTSFVEVSEKSQDEGLDALEMDRFTGFHLLSQEIIELIVRVREAASDIQFVVDESDKVTQTLRQVTTQLQEGMNSSRMVAFGQTADRLPRAIRDISRKLKKQANLHVEGKDVLIDKMIVEHLYNPMTHLVNNAITHGIEKPEERAKRGKPEVGNIYIHAFIQGNQTVITVADDGAGIDTERVKVKAVEKQLVTWAKAQNLSKQEIYEFLFHPGFSTKDQADDFAGRGVGMDVVSTDLKKIRGTVAIESELGKGTTFTIKLPLVLSICKALICVDNHSSIAFPIDGVEDTKEYLPSDLTTNSNGVKCISWKNTLLPLRPLSSLLSYNRQIRRAGIYGSRQNLDDTVSVVILRSIDHLLAVEVDEVRAEQEIVIKQIEGPIPKPSGIAGATVLGDGTIMPIGDVLELIEIAQGKRTIEIEFNILDDDIRERQPQVEDIKEEPMVLVVDDSITVRELLSMSFNKLGYRVEQARDGQEAWDKLRGGLPCDMIFCDIEMPRMNGLELLSNLQKHEELKRIPVAMLTSRGADKHRNLASDLGAKAYLTKPYTEKALMDVAQRLIEINKANQEAESVTVKAQKLKDGGDGTSEFTQDDSPLVLIIDDSVTVRELLSMTFRNAGYRVEQARDGQEAWEKLCDGLNCNIAFCDIEMPRMNGLELLSQLQTDEKLAQLPIAMLTSRGAQKMRNIAAKRGAKGYFVKPYVEETLLDAAKRMMAGEILIDSNDED
ncbi:MAG: response regulator [Pleurocapsa sp.]